MPAAMRMFSVMQSELDQLSADKLMSEAFDALDRGDPKVALKIARKLEQMRYSGCFEIQALAYADLGDLSKAIGVLREGTAKCPDVWLLWQLLGNNLSDTGQFEEAFEAFKKGLSTNEPNSASLNLNYAIALLRSGQPARAEERMRPIFDAPGFKELEGPLRARILAVELEALRTSGDPGAAVAFFEGIGDENFGDDAGAELSILWSEYAQSLFKLDRRLDAERAALRAARFDVKNDRALAHLREVRRKSASLPTSHYKLLVEGKWSHPSDDAELKPAGFFASYSVYADSPEEAHSFVAELQPDQVVGLRISEAKLVNKIAESKGVFSATGYQFYTKESDEQDD